MQVHVLVGKVDVPRQVKRKQLSNLKRLVTHSPYVYTTTKYLKEYMCVNRDTFPDPVIALPHMSLPVNAKGMQAAWNIHGWVKNWYSKQN